MGEIRKMPSYDHTHFLLKFRTLRIGKYLKFKDKID